MTEQQRCVHCECAILQICGTGRWVHAVSGLGWCHSDARTFAEPAAPEPRSEPRAAVYPTQPRAVPEPLMEQFLSVCEGECDHPYCWSQKTQSATLPESCKSEQFCGTCELVHDPGEYYNHNFVAQAQPSDPPSHAFISASDHPLCEYIIREDSEGDFICTMPRSHPIHGATPPEPPQIPRHEMVAQMLHDMAQQKPHWDYHDMAWELSGRLLDAESALAAERARREKLEALLRLVEKSDYLHTYLKEDIRAALAQTAQEVKP